MVMAGLVTFVLVASVLRDRSETTQVWLVDADVAAGALIEISDLTPIDVAADEAILAALMRVDAGVPAGRVHHGLVAGEPLLATDLLPLDAAEAGRTFTIPIDSMVLDGLGLIRGDRVDVIGELVASEMGYVVANVEVVRLPGASTDGAFAAAGSRTTWVTVSIDDREALRLSAALDQGAVHVVRSTGASEISAESIRESLADDGNGEEPELAADEPES